MDRRQFFRCAAAGPFAYTQARLRPTAQAEQGPVGCGGSKLAEAIELTRPVVDIGIVCSHFEESLRFYHELLGLDVVQDLRIPAEVARGAGLAPREFRHVRLRAGNTLIKLMQIADPPPRRSHRFAAGVRWLTLFVKDVRKEYERLKAKGVTFLSEPIGAPDAAGVVCAVDPDGILIELVQLKEREE